jgi:BirA family biotin operon repressor/biotin-[acetyl-CoA-carboxylase] ligase
LTFAILPSTNAWVLDHAAELWDGDVVRAHVQTCGRGRLGRAWLSIPGGGLTFTVYLDAGRWQVLAPNLGQVAAWAVARMARELGLDTLLKWPNDVMAADRKLAGILVETTGSGTGYALGMGLNVNSEGRQLEAAGVDRPVVSLRDLAGRTLDAERVLDRLLKHLEACLDKVQENGLAPLLAAWKGHDWLAGRPIRVIGADREVSGVYGGLAPDGRLRLRLPDGAEASYWTGDVERILS